MHPAVTALWSAAVAAAPQQAPGLPDRLIRFFEDGGTFMFANGVLLAIAVVVIAERTYALFFRLNLHAPPFMEQVERQVLSGNVDRAVKLCAHWPTAPLARVLRAGLLRANKGQLEVARAIEAARLEHTPVLQHRIAWLSSLAILAALIGLLGTIAGLTAALASLGAAPADQLAALLSTGVAQAMNDAAFGLGIAVFCTVAHLVLGSVAKRQVEAIALYAIKLENLVARKAEQHRLDEAA